jgi:cytidylate kinase
MNLQNYKLDINEFTKLQNYKVDINQFVIYRLVINNISFKSKIYYDIL